MIEKYTSTAYANNGTRWVVSIYDTVATSGSSSELLINNFTFSYNADNSNTLTNAIVKSQFSVTFDSVNGELNSFVNDLIDNQEGRYLMRIDKEGNFEWAGIILQDFGGMMDLDTEDIQITAVDGLSYLKSVDIVNTSTPYTFQSYLMLALNAIPTSQFWAINQPFLINKINWIDTRIATGSDTFIKAGVGSELFKTIEKKEGYNGAEVVSIELMNYYEVIETILIPFNARIMLVGGAWTILQTELLADGTVQGFMYDKYATALNSTNLTIKKTIDQIQYYRGGGSLTFIPAANTITCNYLSKDSGSLLPPVIALGTNYVTRSVYTGTGNFLHILGYIDIEFNDGTTVFNTDTNLYFNITLKLGSYYYSNNGWTLTPSYYRVNTCYYRFPCCNCNRFH